MSESRLRIPQVALATLVLGGSSCGGGDSDGGGLGGSAGTNVSTSRVANVAQAVCKWQKRCDPDEDDTEAECIAKVTTDFQSELADDEKCADALLDLYACYATLSCEALDEEADPPEKCANLAEAVDSVCDDQGEDDSDDRSNGGGTAGIDVTPGRIDTVIKAACKRDETCEEESAGDEPLSEAECVAAAKTDFSEILAGDPACADAFLDYYACYGALACGVSAADPAAKACDALEQVGHEKCE